MIERFSNNPLIEPGQVKPSQPNLEVLGAFNPGATLYDGKTLLLVRVAERPIPEKGYVSAAVADEENGGVRILRFREDDPDLVFGDPRIFAYRGEAYLTSISHLRRAISLDGRNFQIEDRPALSPSGPYESYGIEDARIVRIGEDYYVNYSSISPAGVATSLARTRDFQTFERMGILFAPENKDIALFPEKIGGRYYALHRPVVKNLGHLAIWIASSDNLLDWGRHHQLISPRPGMWDSERVGCGASPIRTSEGWLELYHACDERTRYCTGALLLDLEEPWRVIGRSREPFLFPEAPYEKEGFMPNVIFHSGLVERGNGVLDLFYGAADEFTAGATVNVDDILATVEKPTEASTGCI